MTLFNIAVFSFKCRKERSDAARKKDAPQRNLSARYYIQRKTTIQHQQRTGVASRNRGNARALHPGIAPEHA